MKHIYASSVLLLLSVFSYSQYTQNFDVLVNTSTGTYNTFPEGWGIYEVGTGAAADGRYVANNGSSNTGNAYSYGVLNSPDRALGSIGSGGNSSTIGAIFFNETEYVMTSVTIMFTMEQWRFGGNSANRPAGVKDIIPFSYSLDANSIANTAPGTWVTVPQLNLESVITSGAASALDGNAGTNRQMVAYTINGLSIPSGGSILIRWADSDSPGNDDGLAIDDFSISVGLIPGELTSGATNTGGGGGGGGGDVTGTGTSIPIFQHKVAIDSSFLHLYGNMHGHTDYSDGLDPAVKPADAFNFAKAALGMDFLGVSEHNHSTAGMLIANYKLGLQQANTANGTVNAAGQVFTALYGMEYGTLSGGGHVLLYGFGDTLIGWESGAGAWGPTNNYDLFNPKSDYIALFDKVRNNPGAVALLAHPKSSDFTGLTGGYKGVADSAVAGTVIESGPYNSKSTTYSDYPAPLAYISYYRNLLKQGYRVGAHMDQDNHEKSFGTVNGNRIAVLSKDRTREGILNAIRSMRTYATNDYNAQVNFTLGGYVLGSSIVNSVDLSGTVTHTDGDGESISAIQVYGGRVGGGDATLIHSATTNTTFTTSQALGTTWYYYAIITQADGNKIITAPIWLTKADAAPLPVKLMDFTGTARGEAVSLSWNTASEINSDYFAVERSADLVSFTEIGKVAARGSGSSYTLLDPKAAKGLNYYRLRQVDKNGRFEYSKIVTVNLSKQYTLTLSPNPSRGMIQVKNNLPVGQKLMVQVIDIAGNRVYNKQHTSSPNMSVDLTALQSGFYVVRVGDQLTQLVIQK